MSIKFYRVFSNIASMEKKAEKSVQKRQIKNILLTQAPIQKCFEALKDQVWSQEKVIVAVSGGSDSMLTACLLYNFFIKNKYSLQNLYFIHCNHWTRTGNVQDEVFVKNFFVWTQLIITKRKASKKNTENEMRNRRYEAFKQQAKKYKIQKIIFWHNLTDRIESTFLNLLRGANINGLLAMKEQESHHLLSGIQVLRPILSLTKQEVFELCKKNKIPFVTDPTNEDNVTSLRNKLRNKVLPQLYTLANKQNTTTNSFIESMKNIYTQLEKKEEKEVRLKTIKKSIHRKADFAYQRDIEPSQVTNENMIAVMKKLHISNNVTTPLLHELTKFLTKSESGYKYVNKTYVFKSHGNIYIISAPKDFWKKTIDSEKKIDKVTMKRFPRKWDIHKGKKRNERCINQKIPLFRRNFIPILAKKNQITKAFIPYQS